MSKLNSSIMIAVGKIRYTNQYVKIFPRLPGFELIEVLTKSTKYGSLGPFELRNDKNQIFENVYQGSKLYPKVYQINMLYSRYAPRAATWKYHNEQHYKDGKVLPEYWKWRDAVKNFDYPIRRPNGFHSKECIGFILSDVESETPEILDYITARKIFYFTEYMKLIRLHEQYHQLFNKVKAGQNILIAEIDVAFQDDLDYYINKYNVSTDFIKNYTMIMNKKNIEIVLNDDKNPCGHGVALAMALLYDLGDHSILELLQIR